MFVRLAVFPADFSLDAAEMVVSDAVVQERHVLDLLTRLVEKSLVTTVMTGETYRYRLLETLREYALARLDERGEVDRWNDRLLQWAMTRVDHVEASLRRPAQDEALQSVSADAATLRAAMNWADTSDDKLAALRIAAAVPIGLVGERRQIISSLLERLGSGVEPWFAGHAYSALGGIAGSRAIGRRHPNHTPQLPNNSCWQGPHGTLRGPTISASSRLGAPAIWPRRTRSPGRQSTVSAEMVTKWGSVMRCATPRC